MGNFLCAVFGHQVPHKGQSKGWGGYPYCDLVPGPVDGMGRVHAHIFGECPRCEKRIEVGMTHLPKEVQQP